MINNYQSEAGEEDDRDSGSLSVLTTLKEGDQVNEYFKFEFYLKSYRNLD